MTSSNTASAPGKIILSGEYAVVFGYPGVAIPCSLRVEASFQAEKRLTGIHTVWEETHDPRWDKHIQRIINHVGMKKKLPSGILTIKNQMPRGKGLGFSTALNIAVAACLFGRKEKARIEDVEHMMSPTGSGIDFAVIWNEMPLLFSRDEGIYKITLPKGQLKNAFLIDTGKPNEPTEEMIAWVASQKDQSEEVEEALKTIGHCAERIVDNKKLSSIFREHHRAQIVLGVVPTPVQHLIASIESKGGAAKVIGAGARSGGGGMVLAIGIDSRHIPSEYPLFSL